MLFESKCYFSNEAWDYSSIFKDESRRQNTTSILLNNTHRSDRMKEKGGTKKYRSQR